MYTRLGCVDLCAGPRLDLLTQRGCAVSFGMERMNFEVSRWMKGDIATSAKEDAQMLAMG